MILKPEYYMFRARPMKVTRGFCKSCGKILQASTKHQPVFCEYCGHKIELDPNIDYSSPFTWPEHNILYADYVGQILSRENYTIKKIFDKYVKGAYAVVIAKEGEDIEKLINNTLLIVDYDNIVDASESDLMIYAATQGKSIDFIQESSQF